MPYYVLTRMTDSGAKVYVTGHRRTTDAYSGIDVSTDLSPRKALLFGNERNANERAKQLSSDFGTFRVEPYVLGSKVGDVVDDSDEAKAKLVEEKE